MVNEQLSAIGGRIAACRSTFGRSQHEFLDFITSTTGNCGVVSEGTLSKIENHKNFPSAEFLVALDEAKCGTPDYFLFGEERLPICSLDRKISALCNKEFDQFLERCTDFAAKYSEDAVELSAQLEADDSEDADLSVSARRFREVREKRGRTQKEVAGLLSVNHNTVCRNEQREELPKTRYLVNFCKSLEVSASYILDADSSLPPRLSEIQLLLNAYSYEAQEYLVHIFSKKFL